MIRNMQEVLSRLASAFRRRTLDKEFDDEVAAHIELLTTQNERRGLDREEARRQRLALSHSCASSRWVSAWAR
jgi:hypothetical protein